MMLKPPPVDRLYHKAVASFKSGDLNAAAVGMHSFFCSRTHQDLAMDAVALGHTLVPVYAAIPANHTGKLAWAHWVLREVLLPLSKP